MGCACFGGMGWVNDANHFLQAVVLIFYFKKSRSAKFILRGDFLMRSFSGVQKNSTPKNLLFHKKNALPKSWMPRFNGVCSWPYLCRVTRFSDWHCLKTFVKYILSNRFRGLSPETQIITYLPYWSHPHCVILSRRALVQRSTWSTSRQTVMVLCIQFVAEAREAQL